MLQKVYLITDQNTTMNASKNQVISGLIRNVSKVGEIIEKQNAIFINLKVITTKNLLTKYKTNIYSNKEDNKGKYQTETKTKTTNVCKWAKEKSEEFLKTLI